jgi:hypothetical protein
VGFTGAARFLKQHGGMRQLSALIRLHVRTAPSGREHGQEEDESEGASDACPAGGPPEKTFQGVYPMEREVKLDVLAGLKVCAVRLLLKSTH